MKDNKVTEIINLPKLSAAAKAVYILLALNANGSGTVKGLTRENIKSTLNIGDKGLNNKINELINNGLLIKEQDSSTNRRANQYQLIK